MGLLNKLWSGADFWDKQENKQQRDNFAKQDEERKKREAEARAQRQAQQQAQQAQRDAQKASTPNVSVNDIPRKPTTFGQDQPQPDIIKQLYQSTQPTPNPLLIPQVQQVTAPTKLNKFGNPEPVRGREDGKDGTYYTSKTTGKRTFLPDPVKEDHSLWGKVKRNADTVRKTVQGTVGAIPQVGLAAARTATGLVQGAGQLPHMGSAIIATGTEKLKDAWSNPVTRQLDRGAQDLNTGVKTATHYVIDDAFDPINRNIDEASRMYGRTVQGDAEVAKKNYEQTQIGLNVLALLLSGGAAAATKAGKAGEVGNVSKMGKVSAFLNKPIAGSSDDIISKIGGGSIDKLSGAANALNAPFGTTKNKLMSLFGGDAATSEVADAAATGAKAVNTAAPTVTKPNQVAPGVVPTNTKPEVIKPKPVVRPPEPVKTTPKPVKDVPVEPPVKAPVVPKSPEENLAGLKGRRESLAAERDDLLTNGGDVKDVERQIKSIDKAIAEQTTPPKTPEAKALAEGDQQLAEATAPKVTTKTVKPEAPKVNEPNPVQNTKPEISKQEAPSKPKKEQNVTTREMTPAEMTEKGMSEEAIASVMARRAEAAAKTAPVKSKKVAPKAVEPEKVDVAQSTATPVKPEPPKRTNPNAKTVEEPTAPVRTNPNAKTVAPEPAPVELPKKPTQRQLNKSVTENTTKSGKVTAAWKKEQKAAGATDEQINKAVEKVEGRKVPPTESEKQTAENIAENNRVAKENKAKAAAEGKDKQAAPGVTRARAKQTAGETSTPEERASIAKRYAAQTKGVNIEEGMTKAHADLDKISDDGLLEHARKLMTESDDITDADRVFNSIALSTRLDKMRKAAGDKGLKLDKELIDLADEVAQTQALTASNAGLINRLTQEIYKNVPAPVRVQRRLDKLTQKFADMNVDFKPTQSQKDELVALTDKFDSSATSMTGLEDDIAANMDDFAKAGDDEAEAMFAKHKQLEADRLQAQKDTVANSLAFNEKLQSMLPELPASEQLKQGVMAIPDKVGNYLRIAMLSAPSGRIRDVIATSINVIDDIPVNIARALSGKALNATGKTNLVDGMGSWASLKKGIQGAGHKLKASWKGEYTLDEATGKMGTTDRTELLTGKSGDGITSFGVKHNAKGSKYNLPKKAVAVAVQAPTDATYATFTQELYNLGKVEARNNGLTGKRAKQYAEMFMDNPTKEAQQKAAEVWLSPSGMQTNGISAGLTKVTDFLDKVGSKTTKTVDGKQVKIPTAQRFALKSVARIFRTTTIPFVQYTGGATHAMLVKQNPIINGYNVMKAATWQKNPQAVIDNLARGGWNTAKISGLMYAMDKNWVETSDTGADGKTMYNGPYLVRTKPDGSKEYVPASTLGIAGASAVIGAHYLRKSKEALKNGDPGEAIANATTAPLFAVFKATGLNNMMTGQNIFGGTIANADRAGNDPNKSAGSVASTVGWGLVGDVGSQAVPAISRDINTKFDADKNLNPTGEKPDTSGKDPVTGLVDGRLKAKAQITSGIPILSQQLPRKSGALARDFPGRVLNADTQSEQQAAQIAADKKESTTVQNRTNDIVKDDKISKLMSPETRAIYDKYKGDMSKAPKNDKDAVWKDVSAAKDRLLDDGSYDSYNKVLTYERDEAKASGSKTDTEIAEMDRKISRAKVAGERKTNPQIFRLYTGTDTPEGGGLSASEFKKMLQLDDDGKPEYPDLYDPKTATLLWELDEAMTKAGVSGNTNGIDPWTRNKYNLDEALGRGKYAKKGSGKKDPGVATDFGTLGAYAKPPSGSQAQKYQGINSSSPLANLTKASSKTNLKKNISVAKGVRL